MTEIWAHHSQPSLAQREQSAVTRALEGGYVGCGPMHEALIDALRTRTGRRHVFVVLSGTQALCLALASLDLPRMSQVQIPVLGCESLTTAIRYAGHTPEYCDVDAGLRMVPASGTSARIGVHAYGLALAPDMFAGDRTIEDAATTPSAAQAGALGRVSVFSFGSTKYFTGGGGGALLTDDDGCAGRIRDLLSQERSADWTEEPPHPWPGELGDLNCALALAQLDQLSAFRDSRRAIATAYLDSLRGCDAVSVLPEFADHTFFRFIVRTRAPATSYLESLRGGGIDARVSVNPWLASPDHKYPSASAWNDHLLSLPIHPNLINESSRLAETVRKALDNV